MLDDSIVSVDLYVDFGGELGLGHLMRAEALVRYLCLKADNTFKVSHLTDCDNYINTNVSSELCIVDSFVMSDEQIVQVLEKYTKVLVIDDWLYRRIDHPKLAIIDWTLGVGNLINARYRNKLVSTTVFQGFEYAPLATEYNKPAKSIPINSGHCFIYLGGGINYYAKELTSLLLNNLNFEKVTIVGGCLDGDELDSRVSYSPKLPHDKFSSLLLSCDLFICTGGWSMYEALNEGISIGIVLRLGNSVLDIFGAISENGVAYVGDLEDKFISVNSAFKKLNYVDFKDAKKSNREACLEKRIMAKEKLSGWFNVE